MANDGGTPGLRITVSTPSRTSGPYVPNLRRTPPSSGCGRWDSASALSSMRITSRPRRARKLAAATPDLPAPITSMLFNRSSPQFQRGQAEESEDDGHDPEPDHDLRLAPASQLEMMMKRRHLEYAPAGGLERDDLDDHRESLD